MIVLIVLNVQMATRQVGLISRSSIAVAAKMWGIDGKIVRLYD